ncbi:MAG: hypothetical protein OHK0046_24200 [Anaerolineae bacterium]
MRLTFLGGADEVGASSTLIEMGGKRILVDAGIRISPKSSRGIQNDQLPDLHPISEAGGPDYILVTHAHTDHTGALPLVVEQYPHVPVMATRPTQVLTRILQADAQRIMKSKQEEEGELPIFDEIASQRLMNSFQTVEFNQPIRLGDGLQVTYHVAGHIAGAATLVLEGEEGTLVMSGDVSLNAQRAVSTAKIPNIKADALVLESTYGGRLHANREAEEKRLIDTLKAITDRGGSALIPAFALGRAQEVVQIILAYRDRLDVPVYVDGMVRSVCKGYATFADLLPPNTVKMAGDEHLFFREKVKPIENAIMREQVLKSGEPAVIVASSGMLTGGASVVYARALAGDARSAILLTGYQDEEAPGRMLQRMMKERQEGEMATLKLDGKAVTVRCEIDTYSLSAHADEMELVNFAEALDAKEVMLVHGDASARHSLATALRQRGRRVITPRIGQEQVFAFPKRPWAMGHVASGHETRPLNSVELWKALKSSAGNFYSSRELAQMWWGDANRHQEAASALQNDMYFASDWRRRDTFQVRTEDQVATMQRRRAIMLAHPDIIGKLVVLRDSNNRPRVGVVVNAGEDAFEAEVQNAKGRNYPADALLWVIGSWEGYGEGGIKTQLNELMKVAKAQQDILLPFSRRQQLVKEGKPVKPESLVPAVLPPDVRGDIALVAVVLSLAADGATVEQDGLMPKRALEDGPMEQNLARETAFAAFPPEARLRKVGMEIHRKRLTLTFDFPDRAADLYAETIEKLEDQSGWDVQIKQGVSQQALGAAVEELLPAGGRIIKGPSFHLDRGEVHVDVDGVEDRKKYAADYLQLTGYRLVLSQQAASAANGDGPSVAKPTTQLQMEINAAYGIIKQHLEQVGLYKLGLKQGQIVLSFISPQVGERHLETISALANLTGYPLSINPNANQQMITQVVNALIREAGWPIRKGPGIHMDRAEVAYTVSQMPSEEDIARVNQALEEQTGYHLVLKEL